MNLDDVAQRIDDLVLQPLSRFFLGLNAGDRSVLYVLLAVAVALGFLIGRRRARRIVWRRALTFQNEGETLVSRALLSHFPPPAYHLLNHVTLRMDDGTTQIDHVLVSRYGVFVIETKHYGGWIFGNAADPAWTQIRFKWRSRFQNPIFQNRRHVRAVQGLLDFVPPEAIKSVVVFSGDAEFKTDVPQGVFGIGQLVDYLREQREPVMSLNRLQFCVGRLETARLAISGETDVEHVESLARRHGAGPV